MPATPAEAAAVPAATPADFTATATVVADTLKPYIQAFIFFLIIGFLTYQLLKAIGHSKQYDIQNSSNDSLFLKYN